MPYCFAQNHLKKVLIKNLYNFYIAAEEKRSADEVWASLDQAAEELLPPDRPVPEEPEGYDNENEDSSSHSEHSEDEELSASQRKRTGRPVIRKAPAAKRRKTSKK